MLSLSDNTEAHVVETFHSTSRYTVHIENTTRVLLVFHTKIPTFYKCFQSKQLCFVYVSSFIVGKCHFKESVSAKKFRSRSGITCC